MRYMLPLACRCCFLSRPAKRGVIATQLPARCVLDGRGRRAYGRRKDKVETGNFSLMSAVHDSASAVEIVGGQIEFAGVPLPVPQAVAGGLRPYDPLFFLPLPHPRTLK